MKRSCMAEGLAGIRTAKRFPSSDVQTGLFSYVEVHLGNRSRHFEASLSKGVIDVKVKLMCGYIYVLVAAIRATGFGTHSTSIVLSPQETVPTSVLHSRS